MLKSPLITTIENAVLKAGRGLSRDFLEIENLQISKKGANDFVTSADHRAERTLVRELSEKYPDYHFLAEEQGAIAPKNGGDSDYTFIIDPLDGTKNFMHGLPFFAISVGLAKKNFNNLQEIIAGVVFCPATGELFWAEKGKGAYKDSQRLKVSPRSSMKNAMFASYASKNFKNMELLNNMVKSNLANFRILGSAALELCYTAAGKIDGFWHNELKPWDIAAGIVIVREAGGMICDFDEGSDMLRKGSVIASNANIAGDIRHQIMQIYQ